MPTLTWRTPDGQTQTGDLSTAPPQIQALYNTNYSQVQSQTQSAGQGAEQSTLNTQYLEAPQNLKTDLQSGMTLSDAMKKYSALKMNPDDIFKQYLSENTYGPNKTSKLPIESPTQLQGMGVSSTALGKIGDLGSFVDKFNTKNAIDELRNAKEYFNQTRASDIAGNVTGLDANSKAYENARTIVGLHLSSLIPGASGAQSTGNTLLNTLPSSTDARSYTPDMIDKSFGAVEKQLMASRGYSYNDLNLNPPTVNPQDAPKKGGDLLSTLLNNSGKDLSGQAKAYFDANPDLISMLTDPKARANYQNFVEKNNPIEQLKGMVSDYGNILTNPIDQFKEHPVNTAMEVLGPLLGLKGMAKGGVADAGAAEGGAEAATTQAASDVFSKAPGKLQQIANPAKAKSVIGDIRDNIITKADNIPGNTISGDTVAAAIRQWADTSKLGNLSDANAIEEAAKSAELQYAGKTFKPSDLKNIYDSIENSYTTKGMPKSSTAAYIDRGVQGVISDQLEQIAPGFKKTSELFSKAYNTEKGNVAQIVKNLPKKAVGVGMNMGGLGIVAKLLGL